MGLFKKSVVVCVATALGGVIARYPGVNRGETIRLNP